MGLDGRRFTFHQNILLRKWAIISGIVPAIMIAKQNGFSRILWSMLWRESLSTSIWNNCFHIKATCHIDTCAYGVWSGTLHRQEQGDLSGHKRTRPGFILTGWISLASHIICGGLPVCELWEGESTTKRTKDHLNWVDPSHISHFIPAFIMDLSLFPKYWFC